jgi:peptide/nickel transport system permease protein
LGKFLLRRFVNYLVLVLIATAAAYFLAANTLNPRANFENRNPPPPEASVDQRLSELNLNDKDPVLERFGRWAKNAVQGDFGKTVGGESVNEEMRRRMGVSLRLLLIGSILGALLGVALGALAAVRQYRLTDYTATLFSFLLLSTPVFVLAILLQYGARGINDASGSDLLLYVGEKTPGLDSGWWDGVVDRVKHLILPTLSLSLGLIAGYSRNQRNAMLDVLGSDFLRTARAKGLRRGQALVKHGLRMALIPMATFFAYQFGLLLTGAAFTERIFGWHGMGEWFIESISTNDINVVAAVTTFAAVLVLVAGMLADLAYAALDPRVRLQ